MKSILNMVKKLEASHKQTKGYALPLVLVMLAFIITAASFLLAEQISEFNMNAKSRDYEICLLTAKNAMEIVKAEIETGNNAPLAVEQRDLNGGTYSYQLSKTDVDRFDGQISSTYGQYQKTFIVCIRIVGEASNDITDFYWRMES
ncbi:MAG: hypothetical protein PWR12_1717 [Eubacteriaceae bacterium]|nr:hypothetical protein [Eubacteriaceae bacterium]MDK2905641.1 hypothetical protein [Eubacteriaceae bacterium]